MNPLRTRAGWTALAVERSGRRAREAFARLTRPMPTEAVPLTSPLGHALPCRVHLPRTTGRAPGVLLCAGGLDGARGVEGLSPVLTAPRLAREGFVAMAWTPSGREGTPGPEDRNGPLHQEEAAHALQALLAHPAVDPDRVMVVTISFGVAQAVGALTRWPELAGRVRALVDWEGPPSRAWFLSSRLRYQTDEEEWWRPREAVHRIGALGCRYWRMQSEWDHVHGPGATLGDEMVDAALTGSVPEVCFNGRPAADRPRTYAPMSVDRQGDLLVSWIRALAC